MFTTGLLVNLNHIYAGRTDHSWDGFWVFAVSMVVVIVGWVAATPFTLRHPRVVQRVGQAHRRAGRSTSSSTSTPNPASTARKTSPRTSGTTASTPTPTSTTALFDGHFAD